jgi:hypothetical protein
MKLLAVRPLEGRGRVGTSPSLIVDHWRVGAAGLPGRPLERLSQRMKRGVHRKTCFQCGMDERHPPGADRVWRKRALLGGQMENIPAAAEATCGGANRFAWLLASIVEEDQGLKPCPFKTMRKWSFPQCVKSRSLPQARTLTIDPARGWWCSSPPCPQRTRTRMGNPAVFTCQSYKAGILS